MEALLALRSGGRPVVGRDRIDLLDAVATHGSITKAAKVVGLSYKAAWDALNAVNNLLPRPVVVGQAGGRKGGGAVVTEEGLALIAAFRLLEERLTRVAAAFANDGDSTSTLDPVGLLWSLGMKTSARNVFRCKVTEVRHGEINSEVVMQLSSANTMAATLTSESVDDLGIAVGRDIIALVKSSFIMLARGEKPLPISARNQIVGVVDGRSDGPVSSEFTLDIGGGKTITAVITRDSADELDLKEGDKAVAFFKASHVILAME